MQLNFNCSVTINGTQENYFTGSCQGHEWLKFVPGGKASFRQFSIAGSAIKITPGITLTQPFLVVSRNAPSGGALRDATKNGCVLDYSRDGLAKCKTKTLNKNFTMPLGQKFMRSDAYGHWKITKDRHIGMKDLKFTSPWPIPAKVPAKSIEKPG